MPKKIAIADYSRKDFNVLRDRLEKARDTLRAGGRLIQSVARAYYVVYVTASYAAGKMGVKVTHMRDRQVRTESDFSHNEIVDVIHALYGGLKRGNVTDPGSGAGVLGGHYDETNAYRKADGLFQIRIEADYGPTTADEPYTAAEVDDLLTTSKNLVADLETFL